MEVNTDWKEKNIKYINAMQAFLDKVENVERYDLRMEIIGQMLRCDKILTELALREINRNKEEKNNK